MRGVQYKLESSFVFPDLCTMHFNAKSLGVVILGGRGWAWLRGLLERRWARFSSKYQKKQSAKRINYSKLFVISSFALDTAHERVCLSVCIRICVFACDLRRTTLREICIIIQSATRAQHIPYMNSACHFPGDIRLVSASLSDKYLIFTLKVSTTGILINTSYHCKLLGFLKHVITFTHSARTET